MKIETTNVEEITYSSFLSGLFLLKRDLPNMEICTIQADFMTKTGVYFSEYDSDDVKIRSLYSYDSSALHLIFDYDETIIYSGKKYTIRQYLYSITNDVVKRYLRENYNMFDNIEYDNDTSKKKRG